MENDKLSIKHEGNKWGIIVGVAMIAYFLIMLAADLVQIAELRFLNYIFLPVGIALALREITHKIHKHRVNYLPGLGTGIWITVLASAIFAFFMFIYSTYIDKGFVDHIAPYVPFSDYVNIPMVVIAAFGEPLIFGLVFSFVVLQLYKRNRSSRMEEAEERSEKELFNEVKNPKNPHHTTPRSM